MVKILSDTRQHKSLQFMVLLISVILIVLGFTVIVGWIWDISFLKKILPAWTDMRVVSAICFILSGIILWLFKSDEISWKNRFIGLSLAAVIIFFSTSTLLEYYLNIDFLHSNFITSPHMQFLVSCHFLLFGITFFLWDVRVFKVWICPLIALGIFFSSLLPLSGFFYSYTYLYQLYQYTQIPFNVDFGFFLLSIAILISRPERGILRFFLRDHVGGILLRRTFPIIFLIPFIVGFFILRERNSGLYNSAMGIAILTILVIFILLTFVGAFSVVLEKEINKRIESEKKLNMTLKGVGIGTWVLDVIYDKIEVDDLIPLIFGFHHKNEFPQNYAGFLKLLHPDDRIRVDAEFKSSLQQTSKYDTEFRIEWPDGSEHTIAARGLIYSGEEKQAVKITGICWDITGKTLLKKQLENYAKDLAISNQKLIRSNELLQEFAYVTSHDLQEPLRMVGSYVQLLQKRYQNKLDKDADEFIEYAVGNVVRMKALIDGLLIYSRVDTQGKPFKKIDMQQALNWAIANLHQAIKDAGGIISYDQLPVVWGDEIQLGQLFQNLIANSLHYREPKRTLIIHIGVSEKENDWEFMVRDNGKGIDPQLHERVFKIFQRFSAKDSPEGSGIGLSVCKRIVDRHGGKIWVESQLDLGATFYFTIAKIRGKDR